MSRFKVHVYLDALSFSVCFSLSICKVTLNRFARTGLRRTQYSDLMSCAEDVEILPTFASQIKISVVAFFPFPVETKYCFQTRMRLLEFSYKNSNIVCQTGGRGQLLVREPFFIKRNATC